jgi:hypothetical protein
MITILVSRQASLGVGQLTLCSSPMVSRHQRLMRPSFLVLTILSATSNSLLLALKRRHFDGAAFMAGQARIELATSCFGDRHSAKLSYWPVCRRANILRPTDGNRLLCLAMHGVFFAPLAVFIHFHATWIVAAVFLGSVIAFLALTACECDHRSYIFLLGSHNISCSQTI